jgi:hypothetical protein
MMRIRASGTQLGLPSAQHVGVNDENLLPLAAILYSDNCLCSQVAINAATNSVIAGRTHPAQPPYLDLMS